MTGSRRYDRWPAVITDCPWYDRWPAAITGRGGSGLRWAQQAEPRRRRRARCRGAAAARAIWGVGPNAIRAKRGAARRARRGAARRGGRIPPHSLPAKTARRARGNQAEEAARALTHTRAAHQVLQRALPRGHAGANPPPPTPRARGNGGIRHISEDSTGPAIGLPGGSRMARWFV
jgi:hypothetical protein